MIKMNETVNKLSKKYGINIEKCFKDIDEINQIVGCKNYKDKEKIIALLRSAEETVRLKGKIHEAYN